MNQYRADIDGLRAISIIAVVIYHAFPALLPGGFVGVDIFFVISGYLITGIILQGQNESQAQAGFSLAGFYRRRIQRIIPAVLLILIFCLIAGWWVLLPYEYAELGQQTGAAAVFAPNFLFWSEAGYFDSDSRLKPLLHLWSLGVEEQFYLLWPLLLILLAKLKASPLYFIGGLLLLSFAMGFLFNDNSAARFFLPQFRAWELLLGALLACCPASSRPAHTGVALALVGLVMLLAASVLINSNSHFPGWWALLPTVGAVMIIYAGPANRINRMLSSNALVFIGKISFPLYLWHWPLLTFARIMESGEPTTAIKLAAVAASVIIAWVSYRLVETPLRYHKARWVPGLLLAALLATGGLGLLVVTKDGFPARTSQLNTAIAPLLWKELGMHQRDDCSVEYALPGRCLSDGKPATVAVLGDSHSTNVFYALAHAYEDSAQGVIRLGRGGCPPLYGLTVTDSGNRDTCLETVAAHLNWVLGQQAIDTVFLSSMGALYLNPRNNRFQLSHPVKEGPQDKASLFTTALEDTVISLLAADKRVVLVIDWPGLGFHPETCLDTRPLRLTTFEPGECRIPRQRHDRISGQYRQILKGIAARHPSVKLWDTAEAFCNASYCYGMHDGVLLYRDPGHLSLPGSIYLGERLRLSRPGDD